MNVIIVNESEKKALLKSRRVLSKFLPQIGSTVWAGQISEEGLSDLEKKLKEETRSKNTAICCHRILSRSRSAVEWIIGSQANFDEQGRYAFRTTTVAGKEFSGISRSSLEKFVLAITRIAALCHDTGKANRGFAEKLKRKSGAETLRHDLLSFLVHAESLWTPGVTDRAWLEKIAERPEAIASCTSSTHLLAPDSSWLSRVRGVLKADGADNQVLLAAKKELLSLQETAPGLAMLLWLVLTHHRLPEGDSSAQQIGVRRHVNIVTEGTKAAGVKIAPLDHCLELAAKAVPWADPTWKGNLQSAAKAALQALPGVPPTQSLPSHFWTQVAAHHCRPTLILSDHLGSQNTGKTLKKTDAKAKEQIFANLFDNAYYGDTLTTHEIKVARLTRKVANLVHAKMPTAKMQHNSLALATSLPPQYEWQLDLEKLCAQASSVGPAFVSIIAETGAGKTLATARALNALTPGEIRATFALGLRSLTAQLAASMLKDADFKNDDVVVAVGQPETLGLSAIAKELQNEGLQAKEKYGSESSAGRDVEAHTKEVSLDASWVESLCTQKEAQDLFSKKGLNLLTAPLLACTADHLVASGSLLKGGDAKMFLRLATATLVLDEIDAYSTEDLQAIAKLAFMAGSYGRSVILLSATMSPEIQQGLYASWHQGYLVHCALKQKAPQFSCIFSSNSCEGVRMVAPSEMEAKSRWLEYVRDVSAVYASKSASMPLRKLDLFPVFQTGANQVREALVEAAKSLHTNNCSLDPKTNRKVSIGFIRFNTAKSAWRMGEYLAEQVYSEEGPVVKFVTYHSKMPRSYLGVLDATLEQLTNRKSEHKYLGTPALRTILDNGETRDILVLVCTTTLIETGRDFDFDWCVLEPRSPRGEIQAVGRVRRHRRDAHVEHNNVLLLDAPLRALEDPKGFVWSRPGIEDALLNAQHLGFSVPAPFNNDASSTQTVGRRRKAMTSSEAPLLLAEDALPVAAWKVAMDAQLCIQECSDYPSNRIGYLEQKVQHQHLKKTDSWHSSSGEPPSIGFYLNSLAPWNSEHALRTRFRGANESTVLFLPSENKVEYWDSLTAQRRSAKSVEVVNTRCDNALIPDLAAQANSLPGDSVHIRGCALRCPQGGGATKVATWSEVLGFLE